MNENKISAKGVIHYLAGPFRKEPGVCWARTHIANVAAGRSFSWRTIRFADVSPVKPLAENASVSHTFAATSRTLEENGRNWMFVLSDPSRQTSCKKKINYSYFSPFGGVPFGAVAQIAIANPGHRRSCI